MIPVTAKSIRRNIRFPAVALSFVALLQVYSLLGCCGRYHADDARDGTRAAPVSTKEPSPTINASRRGRVSSNEAIASRYESQWPDRGLPPWARKQGKPRDPASKTICFVHVGKTAGSTVGCALGFGLYCKGEHASPAGSLLVSYTTNMFHGSVNDCSLAHDYYLVTLREPLARLQSWYSYLRDIPGFSKLRSECSFETLNDLATKGLPFGSLSATQKCMARARRAILGEEMFAYHNYHNYQYHFNQIPTNASIAVIRAEHLEEDWNAMEALLGSDARAGALPIKNVLPGNTTLDDRYLSTLARRELCYYLCDEIQLYKQVLARAVNLRPYDFGVSMHELRERCPLEAGAARCPKVRARQAFGAEE